MGVDGVWMSGMTMIPLHQSDASNATPPVGGGPETARRFLSIAEFSKVTGLSVSTIQRLRREGKLTYYQPGGPRKRILFCPDAIERAAQLGQQIPSPASNAGDAGTQIPLRGPKPKWRELCE